MYTEMKKKRKSLFANGLFHRRTKRLLNDNEREFEKYLNVSSLLSIFSLIMGIILSVWFASNGRVSSILIGILFLITSAFHLFYFCQRRKFSFYRYSLIYTISCFILSILFFITDELQISPFYTFLGIYFLVMSLETFLYAFYFFRAHDKNFSFLGVTAFLCVFLGILSFIHPFSQLLVFEVIGIFLILYHILHITVLFFLSQRISEFVELFD